MYQSDTLRGVPVHQFNPDMAQMAADACAHNRAAAHNGELRGQGDIKRQEQASPHTCGQLFDSQIDGLLKQIEALRRRKALFASRGHLNMPIADYECQFSLHSPYPY